MSEMSQLASLEAVVAHVSCGGGRCVSGLMPMKGEMTTAGAEADAGEGRLTAQDGRSVMLTSAATSVAIAAMMRTGVFMLKSRRCGGNWFRSESDRTGGVVCGMCRV